MNPSTGYSGRGIVALIAAITAAATMAGCNTPSRTEQCIANGGAVESEREYNRKTGKWATEYECIKDGVEIDEW